MDIFANIEPITPSSELMTTLRKKVPIAAAINTEKARSELIVANVLFELLEQFNYRISLFSGIDFNVDVENGLTGMCDFLVSLSPVQSSLPIPSPITPKMCLLKQKRRITRYRHLHSGSLSIDRCDKILGILSSMVEQKA